jgi:hypothetical protein
VFFKRARKSINPRKQEAVVLMFFMVSFLIYGAMSLWYFAHPQTDPLVPNARNSSAATTALVIGFLLYGLVLLFLRRRLAGKILGGTIFAESAVVLVRNLLLQDVAIQTLRLSGAIEGLVCFAIFAGLLAAVGKGASIWQ